MPKLLNRLADSPQHKGNRSPNSDLQGGMKKIEALKMQRHERYRSSNDG